MKRFFALFAFLFLIIPLVPACSPDALAATQVSPLNTGARDISGTVTLGGTYQTVAAASSSRYNCTIQNPSDASEPLLVKIGTMTTPYTLGAGQSISTLNGTVNITNIITLTATTTGHPFAGTCQ